MESSISNYDFIKNANNEIISAVYPMREHFKKDNNHRMFLGGSIETGLSRFDELGIPLGLYLEPKYFLLHNNEELKKHNNCSIIDDSIFDKLLESVSSVKTNSRTKKNYNDNKSKTKKAVRS